MQEEFWIQRQLEVVVAGPDGPESKVLDQPYALIGSDPACDVVLPDPRLPSRCYLAVIAPSGILGVSLLRRSTARFRPLNGDRGIRAGRFRIRFGDLPGGSSGPCHEHDAARGESACPTAQLRWQSSGRRKYANLQPDMPLLFGRRTPSRLCVEDAAVSSIHGFLYEHGERLWIVDLASTNGTKVNDRSIRHAVITADMSFSIGSTQLRLVRSSQVKLDLRGTPRPPAASAADTVEIGSGAAMSMFGNTEAELACLQQEVRRLQQSVAAHERQALDLEQREVELAKLRQEFELRQVELYREQEQQLQWCREQRDALEAERESHEANLQRWEQERRAERAQLEEQRSAWTEQLERERMEWCQEQAAALAKLAADREELQRQLVQLSGERETLEAARLELAQQQADWMLRVRELESDRTKFQEEYNERLAELDRVKELLLVRRIRIQRELQRRESELVQRQRDLEAREETLRKQIDPLTRPESVRPRRRTIPLPPGVKESVVRQRTSSSNGSNRAADEQFELANPLLESADFTHLLNKVIGDIDTDSQA